MYALQSIQINRSFAGSTYPTTSSHGISCSFQVTSLKSIALSVRDPTLLLDHFLSCVVFHSQRYIWKPKAPNETCLSSAFLQSFSRLTLVGLPQQTNSSHGLYSPSAHVRFKGLPNRQDSTPAYVPPSGFGYPPDDLLPLNPSELFFTLAALLGFTLRSMALQSGIVTFQPQMAHMLFPLNVMPLSKLSNTATQAAAPGHLPFRKAPIVTRYIPVAIR
jgi:hypothetical protein